MKILTAAEMAATDKQSVEQGVPVAVLMEKPERQWRGSV